MLGPRLLGSKKAFVPSAPAARMHGSESMHGASPCNCGTTREGEVDLVHPLKAGFEQTRIPPHKSGFGPELKASFGCAIKVDFDCL